MLTMFLSSLLDEVEGGRTNTVLAEWGDAYGWSTLVGQAMVASLDEGKLTAAADAARAADKEMTAEWLELIAADWPRISGQILSS
jgi:hypothetical protein